MPSAFRNLMEDVGRTRPRGGAGPFVPPTDAKPRVRKPRPFERGVPAPPGPGSEPPGRPSGDAGPFVPPDARETWGFRGRLPTPLPPAPPDLGSLVPADAPAMEVAPAWDQTPGGGTLAPVLRASIAPSEPRPGDLMLSEGGGGTMFTPAADAMRGGAMDALRNVTRRAALGARPAPRARQAFDYMTGRWR